jgi:hypothetical protein
MVSSQKLEDAENQTMSTLSACSFCLMRFSLRAKRTVFPLHLSV